jgi:TonB family protein
VKIQRISKHSLIIVALVVGGGCAPSRQDQERLPDGPLSAYESEFPKIRTQLAAKLGYRPRAKFVAVDMEPSTGLYVEKCLKKIMRTSEEDYPDQINGIYGRVTLTMTIDPDGNLLSVGLTRTSGSNLLDQAAARIVRLSAPFESFPSSLREEIDILVVTRTFTFTTRDDNSFSIDAPLWNPSHKKQEREDESDDIENWMQRTRI